MSRKEWENDEWMFVAGVDNVTGAFLQVWNQPVENQDCDALIIKESEPKRNTQCFRTP